MPDQEKKRLLFLYTGGTIAMDLGLGGDASLASLGAVAKDLAREVPAVARVANVDSRVLMNADSADLVPADWCHVAAEIHGAIASNRYEGIVVVHGTDTMAYGASLVAFLLGPVPIPVVFTGAQRPLSDVRSDAARNLADAAYIATRPLPEVMIVFGSRALRAVRATKVDAWGFGAFETPMCAPLVELGLGDAVAPHVRSPGSLGAWDARLVREVWLVRVHPGLDPGLIRAGLDAGVRGLVLATYGTGTLPTRDRGWLELIEEAGGRGLCTLVVSQCERSYVELGRYGGGAAALAAGAVSGGDMTEEAALAKMMVGLAREPNLEFLRAFLQRSVLGERSEHSLRYT